MCEEVPIVTKPGQAHSHKMAWMDAQPQVAELLALFPRSRPEPSARLNFYTYTVAVAREPLPDRCLGYCSEHAAQDVR